MNLGRDTGRHSAAKRKSVNFQKQNKSKLLRTLTVLRQVSLFAAAAPFNLGGVTFVAEQHAAGHMCGDQQPTEISSLSPLSAYWRLD